MTKRTNFTLFLALFLPLFLQAQMQKGLCTMRPALSINKGEERTDYGIGMNYGKMLNDDILVSGGIGGGTGSGKKSAYIGSFGANVGIQYFYLNDSKWNPYLSANVAYSVTRLRLQFVNTLPGSIVKDTVFNYNILKRKWFSDFKKISEIIKKFLKVDKFNFFLHCHPECRHFGGRN